MYDCIVKNEMAFFFIKALRVPKWLIYTPRRHRSRYRRPKRVSQVDKTEDPKNSEAQIPVGIRKSRQRKHRWDIQMSANDQERPLLAIIPESYPQTADSWQGFDLRVKGKGVLAPPWGWGSQVGGSRHSWLLTQPPFPFLLCQ